MRIFKKCIFSAKRHFWHKLRAFCHSSLICTLKEKSLYWYHSFKSLIACGSSGNLMSLSCCGRFIFLTADKALVGAADKPAWNMTMIRWTAQKTELVKLTDLTADGATFKTIQSCFLKNFCSIWCQKLRRIVIYETGQHRKLGVDGPLVLKRIGV